MRPIPGFRRGYLPLQLVYLACGATGIIDVSRDMWVKERLTLNPAELAGIGVWLSLPWTVKMVFGQLVDSVSDLRTIVRGRSALKSMLTGIPASLPGKELSFPLGKRSNQVTK